MWGFFIALISGACMSIQGIFNTNMTKNSSLWVTNCWVQFTALLVCLAGWAITDRTGFTTIFKMESKYMLLGGVLGAFITLTVVKAMEALGPANAVLIIVVSQIAVAYLIEVFGIFKVEKVPFSWMKLVGLGLAIAGIFIFEKN